MFRILIKIYMIECKFKCYTKKVLQNLKEIIIEFIDKLDSKLEEAKNTQYGNLRLFVRVRNWERSKYLKD